MQLKFILLLLILTTTHLGCMDIKNAFSEIQPCELSEEDAKSFILNFNNLPNELQCHILEYVHQDYFEPFIGDKGAYVHPIKIPSGKGGSPEAQNHWKSIRNFPENTIGPNKKNWVMLSKLSGISFSNTKKPKKKHQIGTWCENYSFCLHPIKDRFVVSNQAETATLVEIYSLENYNKEQSSKKTTIIDLPLTGIEFCHELDSDVLIGFNDESIYKIPLLPVPPIKFNDDQIKKIISAHFLREKAREKNYVTQDSDSFTITRVTLSAKFPGLFIAVTNNRFSFLCDYNSQKVFMRVLEVLDKKQKKQPISFFCERLISFTSIREDADYAQLKTRRLLHVSPKHIFLAKQIKVIAQKAQELKKYSNNN